MNKFLAVFREYKQALLVEDAKPFIYYELSGCNIGRWKVSYYFRKETLILKGCEVYDVNKINLQVNK